jgi:hypothetical protein
MSLLGNAAMVLSFKIASNAIEEHDDWHSHEHLHERMLIPGFLRGSRWVSLSGERNYFVMYEVTDIEILSSQPYLKRLNKPSQWTSKIMKCYRGMNRGLCRVICSYGLGLGSFGMLIQFCPDPENESTLREWLCNDVLRALPSMPGLVSAHLLKAAQKTEFTEEQRIRGKDCLVDWVILVTGYGADALMRLANSELSLEKLGCRGALNTSVNYYQMMHLLTAEEEVTTPEFDK